MITDKQAEESQDWLFANADNIGEAKAMKEFTDEQRKITKAELILQAEGTVTTKESIALTSPEYKEAVKKHCAAIRTEAQLLAQQRAHETRIEFWRSQSANLRGKI